MYSTVLSVFYGTCVTHCKRLSVAIHFFATWSICHIRAPCLNRSTDLDAICEVQWHVLLGGGPWPPMGRGRLGANPQPKLALAYLGAASISSIAFQRITSVTCCYIVTYVWYARLQHMVKRVTVFHTGAGGEWLWCYDVSIFLEVSCL